MLFLILITFFVILLLINKGVETFQQFNFSDKQEELYVKKINYFKSLITLNQPIPLQSPESIPLFENDKYYFLNYPLLSFLSSRLNIPENDISITKNIHNIQTSGGIFQFNITISLKKYSLFFPLIVAVKINNYPQYFFNNNLILPPRIADQELLFVSPDIFISTTPLPPFDPYDTTNTTLQTREKITLP